MPELVAPSAQYRDSYLAAVREFGGEGTQLEPDFERTLQRAADYASGRVPAGHVAQTTYWLVDPPRAEYLGRVSIRHALTPGLERVGGHIGYAVRPSRRREGHGTRLLELALPKAHALGIDPVLVTCDDDNLGSRKIIEACGGVLATDLVVPGELRFWVATRPATIGT